MGKTGKAASGGSFQEFFQSRLLPILQEFEATRRKRYALLAGLLFALNTASVTLAAMLSPIAWNLWHIYVAEAAAVSGAMLVAGRLGWRGLDRTNDRAPILFQSLLLAVLILTALVVSLGNKTLFARIFLSWFIVLLVLFTAAATGLTQIIDKALFNALERRWRFSKEIVQPLALHALPRLTYAQFGKVKQADFMASNLFPPIFNHYHSRDGFSGQRQGYRLSFAWLNVEMNRDERRSGATGRKFVFSGWFFVAEFPRRFHGQTLMLPDVAESRLGWLGRSLQGFVTPPGGHLVHLEDVKFEKRFKVISTGQLDARFIMSPAFMRLATDMRRRVRRDFSTSFKDNKMFVAMPTLMEYFTFIPNQSFTNPAFARSLFHAIRGVDDMAREIRRNQVIWADNAPEL